MTMSAPKRPRRLSDQQYMVFQYLYRDADNSKVWGAVLLRGQATPEQVQQFATYHHPDWQPWFRPERMGVARLDGAVVPQVARSRFDHGDYHEVVGLQPATDADLARLPVWGSTATFAREFARTQGFERVLLGKQD